jgi:hypothetical protein
VTLSETVVVCAKLPAAPRMLSVKVPVEVRLVVLTFRIEEPDPVTDAGLNVADAPWDNPLTLNATLPEKPFAAAMLTVKVVLCPRLTVCEAGEAVSEKSGWGGGGIRTVTRPAAEGDPRPVTRSKPGNA